jgi:hypothetical protein
VIRKSILVLLACCVVIPVFSWGFFAHKMINRLAVFTLPESVLLFYKTNIEYITEHAVDADMRRYSDPEEACRHYIDLDYYEGFLRKINKRVDEKDKDKKYERVAMAIGDFKANPIILSKEHPSDKELRIETFIEDICAILKERYEMLKIIKY